MDKRILAQKVAHELKLPVGKTYKVVSKTFKVLLDAMIDGHEVDINGFGVFKLIEMRGTARNPLKEEIVDVEGRKRISFRPKRSARDKINSGEV